VKVLEVGELLALPIQSAIRAQSLAFQETFSFVERFGFEEGLARSFRFKAERMVEERTVDPKTGIPETRFKTEPFEVSIPLLALVTPPTFQLQEMNVELGLEVVEPRRESMRLAAIPAPVLGSSLAPSLGFFTPLSESNPTTMKVSMKIVRQVPEGMARLGDLLTDLLAGHTPSSPEGAKTSV